MPIFELENLVKIYSGNTKALGGIHLSLAKGEIFGLLGPNGAGKTSLIRILIGFAQSSAGTIKIFDEKPNWKLRLKIGYLPERISIHPFLTPMEFLEMKGRISGMDKKLIRKSKDQILSKVGLEKEKDRRVGTFSKGMMQRLGLAAAILNEPDLILLDEPGSGLDPVGTVELRELILEEKKRGATILINSHRLSEIEKICDRFGIINKGMLIAVGTIHELQTGSRKITFQLANPEDAGSAVLKKMRDAGLTAKQEGPFFEIGYSDGTIIKELPSWIVEAGGDIVKYEKQGESLEEIFMRVVKSE